MKKIGTIFNYFAGAASIVGLWLFIYYQYIAKDIPIVDIKEVDIVQLTNLPVVDNLNVEYKYKDSTIKNLWKIKYFVKNIGPKTIVAEGNLKNIVAGNIPLKASNISKVFSLKATGNNFPIEIKQEKTNQFSLTFKQWRENEYFEITGFVETSNNSKPQISIDERDIIDSKVNYSIYELDNKDKDNKLIKFLPLGLVNFIKWFLVVLIIVADIAAIFAIKKELTKQKQTVTLTLRIFSFLLWLLATLVFTAPLLWIF